MKFQELVSAHVDGEVEQPFASQIDALIREGGPDDFSEVYSKLEDAQAELSLIIAHPMPEEGEEYRQQLGAIRPGAVFGYRRDGDVAP